MVNKTEVFRRIVIAVLVVILYVGFSSAFEAGTDAISRKALASRGEKTTAHLVGSSVLYGKVRRDKYSFVDDSKKKHATIYEHPATDPNDRGEMGKPSQSVVVWYLPDNPNVCRVSVSGQRPTIAEEEAQYAFVTAAAYLIVGALAAFVLKQYAGTHGRH